MDSDFAKHDGAQKYRAYGLKIKSVIPLTEFEASCSAPGDDDVVVTYGKHSEWSASEREQASIARVSRDAAQFWFRGAGAFRVENGRTVTVIPEPGVDPGLLRLYVQGMMMATVLFQRGFCVLHASVVNVAGRAIAVMGQIGAGKSSVAAALYLMGHCVIADDNAAVDTRNTPPTIAPGYPSVKLFPHIASALGFDEAALTPLHRSMPKFTGAVTNGFLRAPAPLGGIYVLGDQYDQGVTPLAPLQATMECLKHSVPMRFRHAGDAEQLRQCATIASQVPAFALRTFCDPSEVRTVAETLERHSTQMHERNEADGVIRVPEEIAV